MSHLGWFISKKKTYNICIRKWYKEVDNYEINKKRWKTSGI